MTNKLRDDARLEQQTDEGAEVLQPVQRGTSTQELVLTGGLWPDETETTIINMGPQHPSTHGVLRVMLELDGETVLRVKPVIGYLHTGMEKTAEELTYVQGATNVTRMDYLSPLSNELVWSMAVERLLDLEIPSRATWIRMYLVELNRIASHLLFQATNGMDIGAVSMMIYGFRDREETLGLLEKITGLRMNHNFIRPGGVAADLPDGWQEDTIALLDQVEKGVRDYSELLDENPIWLERLVGVGVLSTDDAIALGVTGPILRSTGFPWDLRKAQPYLAYDEVEFNVVYTENGDCYDRYLIRLDEILESAKIVRQCVERMPDGDYRSQDRKVTPPPRARIDESMEALIHHFKLFTEGFKVPPGETYAAVESAGARSAATWCRTGRGSPRACTSGARASTTCSPRRRWPRGPSSPTRSRSSRRSTRSSGRSTGDRADPAVERPEGRPQVSCGRASAAMVTDADARRGLTDADRRRAKEIVSRYPHAKSALLPLLHVAQDRNGWVTPAAMEEIADLLDLTPALVLGTCSFYTMLKREPVGGLIVSVCTNVSCLVNGGPELLEALRAHYGETDDVLVEEVECLAACDLAPVLQVNYEFHGPVTPAAAIEVIEQYRRGELAARTVSGSSA